MITIIRTDSDNADFGKLVILLDQDLAIRDGDDHSFYAQFNKTGNLRNVVIATVNNEAVGCGAFRLFDENAVEIKRMFVLPAYRGKGIAAAVLKELEQWAAGLGYRSCVLETGKNQPEAIRLYEKSGYTMIPNYGQYAGVENSVCMKKVIA